MIDKNIDPRTRFIIVLCISTLSIITKEVLPLVILLGASIFISLSFKVNVINSIKRIKGLLYIFIGIGIIQSIFSSGGQSLVQIGGLSLLTKEGITKGLEFILRMSIIIVSATVLTTSNSREIIQGFIQWGLPYEIAFMVLIGIRFLPILREEIQDSLIAIQLRGIELEKIPIRKKLSLYSYLFTPILVGTILKAEKLSISIEMRGFRAYENRTSYMLLKMGPLDYIIITLSIISSILFVTLV